MKKLNVILFKSEEENRKYSEAICERLSRSKLSTNQEFCGIWGEIQFNRKECVKAVSATVNFALSSDKTDVYFGCAEKDYGDIISQIDRERCEINILPCACEGGRTMTVGEKLSKMRKLKGFSAEELAELLSVSGETVNSWEDGATLPDIENLLKLRGIFGVSLDQMLDDESDPVARINSDSMDTVCAALAYAAGVEAPACAAEKNAELSSYIDQALGGEKADRIVMYNPDAIAQWVYEKYPDFLKNVKNNTEKEIYLSTVMPSVTPVCFATMYTGAQPAVHGIRKYEKPVISIDTLFDAFVRAEKKVALITYGKCSLSRIYLKREIDYYHFEDKKIDAVNAKAMEVILRDEHDLIVIYNGNFDAVMHKKGPESAAALAELRVNDHVFGMISQLIKTKWQHHNTLVGFAMDHGCHEIDGGCGSHGLDMPEDINVVHFYKCYAKNQ